MKLDKVGGVPRIVLSTRTPYLWRLLTSSRTIPVQSNETNSLASPRFLRIPLQHGMPPLTLMPPCLAQTR